MKRQLHKRYPDLINMRGSVDTVKQALADALEEIWKDFPESLLKSHYTSIPRRVAAVIKAEEVVYVDILFIPSLFIQLLLTLLLLMFSYCMDSLDMHAKPQIIALNL